MRFVTRRGRRAGKDCDCRLCRPGDESDPRDAKAVSDVRDHGVHVLLVSDEGDSSCEHEHDHPPSDEPAFAYTVGLWHHRRHPELLISGLARTTVMHRALNELAQRVVDDGERLVPGEVYEGALGGVPVTVEETTAEGAGHATWSEWFHRRPVPVLQVVWPDLDGVFAWQGGEAPLDEAQPVSWRVPGPRTGALAPSPSWLFPVPPETLVLVCGHVVAGDPVRHVVREVDAERGEDWQVLCGGVHADVDGAELWHLQHVVTKYPGVRALADLPLDSAAERPDERSPWSEARP